MGLLFKLKKNFFIFKILVFWIFSGFLFSKLSYTSGVVTTVIAMLFYFLIDLEKKYIFILSMLPMAAIFKVSLDFVSSIVIFYFLFICEYYFKRKKINKNTIFSLLIFIICQILAVLIYEANFINIIAFLLNIIFCLTSFEFLKKVKDKEYLLKKISLVYSLVMCIDIGIAKLYPHIPFEISYVKQIALKNAGRFCALNADPNYYNQLVAVAICLLLSIVLRKKITINKIFYILLIVILSYFGLESHSKSFALSILSVLIFLMILRLKNGKNGKKELLKKICICFFISLVGVYVFYKIIIPLFIERSMDHTTLLSNREEIWKNYIYNFLKTPLVWFIGSGIMNGGNILASGRVAHNVYLELLSEIGIVGIGSLIIIFKGIILKCEGLFRNVDLLFVFILLLTSFSLSLSSNDAIFVLLPLCALRRK